MKKILLLSIFLSICIFSFSQSTVLLRGDTIKVYKQGGSATLRVDSILMLTKYRQGNANDSVLRWDPVTKTVRMSDAAGIGGGNYIFNESVVESNDSVFLRNEKVEPATEPSIYGYQDGTYGYKPTVLLNLTNPENRQKIVYKNGEFVNVTVDREMRFTAGDADYIAVGDSTLTDTVFENKKLKIYREGARQWQSTVYEAYSFRHVADAITLVPPVSAGERFIIEIYDTLLSQDVTHIEPPAWEDLFFVTNTGLINTSQVFTSTGSAGFGHTGLDVLKLAAGEDGFIAIQYTASDGVNAAFGFNTTNAEQVWGNFEAGIDIAGGGDIYRIDGGTLAITSCTGISTGDWVGINRTGSTLKLIRKSGSLSSNLADWTVCYTFSFSSSADLFIGCDLFTPGSAKMYYPQGFNVQ